MNQKPTLRQKVSTLLEPTLFRQAKLEAVRQGKQISEIFSEALRLYLSQRSGAVEGGTIVAATWGSFELDPREVDRILDEEEGLFDS